MWLHAAMVVTNTARAIEIRPVTRAEAVSYLRVLPFTNGLPSWEPAPAAWHGGAGAWPPPNAPATADELEASADEVVSEGFRSQASFVDGKIAGGSALLSLQLTVPAPTRASAIGTRALR